MPRTTEHAQTGSLLPRLKNHAQPRQGMGIALLTGVLSLTLVGCASSSSTISGKVIAGEVDIAMPVSAMDTRLERDGLAGASVSLGTSAHSPTPLTQTQSGPDGRFSITLPAQQMGERMGLRVELPGYVSLRSMATMPSSDEQLLVILEPIHGND